MARGDPAGAHAARSATDHEEVEVILAHRGPVLPHTPQAIHAHDRRWRSRSEPRDSDGLWQCGADGALRQARRSEEHTSELQSLMRISYAVFCLKKKKLNQVDKEKQ